MSNENELTKQKSAKEFLTLKETSAFLNLKISKLRTMVFKKEIPVIRLGRCLRFEKSELLKWVDERTTQPAN